MAVEMVVDGPVATSGDARAIRRRNHDATTHPCIWMHARTVPSVCVWSDTPHTRARLPGSLHARRRAGEESSPTEPATGVAAAIHYRVIVSDYAARRQPLGPPHLTEADPTFAEMNEIREAVSACGFNKHISEIKRAHCSAAPDSPTRTWRLTTASRATWASSSRCLSRCNPAMR